MDPPSEITTSKQRSNRIFLVVLVIVVIVILLFSLGVISINTSGFNSSKDNKIIEDKSEQTDLESYINEYMLKQDIAFKNYSS